MRLIAALLIFVCGYALCHWREQPTPMQMMTGIHDHMNHGLIRAAWKDIYCDTKGQQPLEVFVENYEAKE
jgi:hypothetical protein